MDKTLQGLQDLFGQLEKTNDRSALRVQLEEDYWDGQLLAKLEIVDTGTLDTMVRDINTKQTETYSHEFRSGFESEIDFKRAIASDFE
jgi:hypothetical protein